MSGIKVSLAPEDGWLIASPDWEQIDTTYNVREITIDRGRENEMSQTGTGTATVELVDRLGDFDPTNPAGAFFGRQTIGEPMGPLVQAKIELQNPDTAAWSTLFRGYISRLLWMPYRRKDHANVTLELVDGLALLAACEMAPDGTFGNAVVDGNIVFDEDANLDAVQTRINVVLDQMGWPSALRSIFTGNVSLQSTVYAPRATVLQVVQDAADAEFPQVANVYVSGPRGEVGDAPPGSITFHGRYARFNPDDVSYDIRTWQCGDDAAADDFPTTVRISPPMVVSLDDTSLFTSALATPQNVADGDIAAQYVTDSTAAGMKGLRTWSAENLATFGGDDDRTALQETRLMADYVRDNWANPAIRVGQLTIKSRSLSSVNGEATWAMLTAVDISDIVHLSTTHGTGGGFETDFYVEGIHYLIRPGGLLPYAELTVDVSPTSFYDSNPWAS